jgi:CheY-like chemotaxis protein
MCGILVDGLSCARRIRNLESEGTIVRHVPIIAVTANARLEQIETAIAAGMVCIKAG